MTTAYKIAITPDGQTVIVVLQVDELAICEGDNGYVKVPEAFVSDITDRQGNHVCDMAYSHWMRHDHPDRPDFWYRVGETVKAEDEGQGIPGIYLFRTMDEAINYAEGKPWLRKNFR